MVSFINQRFYYKSLFENNEREILIISVFDVNEQKYKMISEYQGEKMLFLTEPIKNLSKINDNYYWVYKLFIENKFNSITGCINNDRTKNYLKYPLYLLENNFDISNDSVFKEANENVLHASQSDLQNKSFCCLINSWDTPALTRTKMYDKIKKIGFINCPGRLFNNCSNEELNCIGKVNYLKNYLFNICSENFDNNNIEGYVTEKLMDCCLSGSVPIYCGSLDDIDKRIFNIERIIRYDSNSEESIEIAYKQVNELCNNPVKLLEYYQRPIFCNGSYDEVFRLNRNLKEFLNIKPNKLKTYVICNKQYEKERYDFLMKQIKILGINSFLDIRILDDFTWKDDITDKYLELYCKTDYAMEKHGRNMKTKPLNRGEVSLFINHIKCLEDIIQNETSGNFLILESDVIFKRNTRVKLEEILNNSCDLPDWDIINIGEGQQAYMKSQGYPRNSPNIINNYKFYKENINRCTESMIWNYKAINKFLDYFKINYDINGPIDTVLDVFSNENDNFNIYWSEKTLFVQGSINKKFNSHLR